MNRQINKMHIVGKYDTYFYLVLLSGIFPSVFFRNKTRGGGYRKLWKHTLLKKGVGVFFSFFFLDYWREWKFGGFFFSSLFLFLFFQLLREWEFIAPTERTLLQWSAAQLLSLKLGRSVEEKTEKLEFHEIVFKSFQFKKIIF